MSSTISPVFNRMLSASQIEDAFTDVLQKWMPTYLREMENQLGLPEDTFPIPVNYTKRNSFDAEKGEPIPKIVVLSTGIVGAPRKSGFQQYRAVWNIGVGVAMAAPTEQEADELCKGYCAVIKAIILQNKDENVPGTVDIVWTGESYPDLPIVGLVQYYKAGGAFFQVDVEDVVTAAGGPTAPDQPPYDYGEVETVDIEIIKVPINQEVP